MSENYTIETREDLCTVLERDVAHSDITLYSPATGASFAGIQYYANLIELTKKQYPSTQFKFVVDCSTNAGWVMAGLRQGLKYVKFSGDAQIAAKLQSQAQKIGAEVIC